LTYIVLNLLLRTQRGCLNSRGYTQVSGLWVQYG